MRLGAETLDDGGLDLTGAVSLGLERYADAEAVVAIAADLPFVTADDVRELLDLARAARGRRRPRRHHERRGSASSFGPRPELRPGQRGAPRRAAGAHAPPREGHRHAGRSRVVARVPVRVTLLAGGVGGARFARGLVAAVDPASVTIIGNVGDDVELLGLHISPDLDTVLYTLSGRIDPVNGWGVAGDTREAMTAAAELGGPDWFILGDRDIGLHLVRSERLRAGEPLSSITADLAARLGLAVRLLPATDDHLRTFIGTDEGELDFQQWLVGHRAGRPRALRPLPGPSRAARSRRARSHPRRGRARARALEPVRLARPDPRGRGRARRARRPARARRRDLADHRRSRRQGAARGHARDARAGPGALGVAKLLAPLAAAFVLDEADVALAPEVEALGVRAIVAPSLMRDLETSRRLAEAAIASVAP